VANADGVILVLNGADESMKYNFRIEKSRGLIVLEMISSISQRISGMKLIWKT
jgi:hypothetical protein